MASLDEDESKNTHQENFRMRFEFLDASGIIPFPLFGLYPSVNMLYFCLGWLVLCVALAFVDRSILDIVKYAWHRRTRKCHARLKNNR